MNCRIVLIFLYLLIAQALCGPVRKGREIGAMNGTMRLIHDEIKTTLGQLADSRILPTTCQSLKISKVLGEEQQNLTAQHLSSFSCHMQKMSKVANKTLSDKLLIIGQYAQDVAQRQTNQAPSMNCSVPTFDEDMKRYEHVKCVLQNMEERLSSATSDLSA